MVRIFTLVVVLVSLTGCGKSEPAKKDFEPAKGQSSSSASASKVYDQLDDSPRLKKK